MCLIKEIEYRSKQDKEKRQRNRHEFLDLFPMKKDHFSICWVIFSLKCMTGHQFYPHCFVILSGLPVSMWHIVKEQITLFNRRVVSWRHGCHHHNLTMHMPPGVNTSPRPHYCEERSTRLTHSKVLQGPHICEWSHLPLAWCTLTRTARIVPPWHP